MKSRKSFLFLLRNTRKEPYKKRLISPFVSLLQIMTLRGSDLWWEKGNNVLELGSPRFGLSFPVDSKWPWTPHFLGPLKTQKSFLHQRRPATEGTELSLALTSVFIIPNIFRAEMGAEPPHAISESELITLFYKMIIVGFFGFFFPLMRPTAGQASLSFKHW